MTDLTTRPGARLTGRGRTITESDLVVVRGADRRLAPAALGRRVGGREPLRRAHRPRDARALLLDRAGAVRPRAGRRAARLRLGHLQAPGRDRRDDPRRGRGRGRARRSTRSTSWSTLRWRVLGAGDQLVARARVEVVHRTAVEAGERRRAPERGSTVDAPTALYGDRVLLVSARGQADPRHRRRQPALDRVRDRRARAARGRARSLLTSFGRVRRMTERAAKRPARAARRPRARRQLRRRPRGAPRASSSERWGGVDGVVHAIAFAPGDALGGDFLDDAARERAAPRSRPAPTRCRRWRGARRRSWRAQRQRRRRERRRPRLRRVGRLAGLRLDGRGEGRRSSPSRATWPATSGRAACA